MPRGPGAQTQPVDYTIAFFYLDSDTLTAAQPADIALLKSDDFTRDFAVTLFAPNIENRLLVQKVDADTGAPLDGATFALYDAADVVQGAVRDGAKPVMTSAPTGSYQLGAQTIPGVAVLNRVPLGQYVLLEDQVRMDTRAIRRRWKLLLMRLACMPMPAQQRMILASRWDLARSSRAWCSLPPTIRSMLRCTM